MNPAFASEVVECLRVSGSPRIDSSRLAISRHQWKQALEWLDHSGIALLFWKRLKELGEVGAIPFETGECLERNLADHRLRLADMVAEFDSINQGFESAGLKYAAMKGLALPSDYCPDILLRTTYDYDYLLPRESIRAAENVLKAVGYIRKDDPEEHPIVYFHKDHPPRAPLCRDDLYSPAFPRTVELHYLFWDAGPVGFPLKLPFDPLDELELRHFPAYPGLQRRVYFYALSEANDLIFELLHAFRHILHGWCRLRSLLDIACLLDRRASDDVFWREFLKRLKSSPALADIAGVVFLLSASLFGAKVPDFVASRTTSCLRPPLVSWVNRYGKSSALQNFSDNKFSLFLHREFIGDDATWRAIERSRLFPAHRPNQAVNSAVGSLPSRVSAKWKQAVYVSRRLKHHVKAAARYKLESRRWNRIHSCDN